MRIATSSFELSASSFALGSGRWKRRDDYYSIRATNERYHRDLWSYVTERYPRDSQEDHFRDLMLGPPQVARTVIENYWRTDEERHKLILRHYLKRQGSVTVTLGGKGEQKTTWNWGTIYDLWRLAGWRPVDMIGDEGQIPTHLQEIVRPIGKLNQARRGSIIFADELAVLFPARNSQSAEQRNIAGELALIRQNHNLLFGVVQNLSTTDKSILTLADEIVVKPLGLTQSITERTGLWSMIDFWSELMPREPEETFFRAKKLHPVFYWRDRPDWLDTAATESFQRIDSEEQAVERALDWIKAGRVKSWRQLKTRMEIFGQSLAKETWKKRVVALNGGADPLASDE